MATTNVASGRDAAHVGALLASPEITRLITQLEQTRWTGTLLLAEKLLPKKPLLNARASSFVHGSWGSGPYQELWRRKGGNDTANHAVRHWMSRWSAT